MLNIIKIYKMIPSVFELHDVLFNDDCAKRFLIDNNVFYESIDCTRCQKPMTRDLLRSRFRCYTKNCRMEFSLKKYTFFEGSRLKMNQILYLGRLTGATSTQAQRDTRFSKHTV